LIRSTFSGLIVPGLSLIFQVFPENVQQLWLAAMLYLMRLQGYAPSPFFWQCFPARAFYFTF
jgi:hypothetical protein